MIYEEDGAKETGKDPNKEPKKLTPKPPEIESQDATKNWDSSKEEKKENS